MEFSVEIELKITRNFSLFTLIYSKIVLEDDFWLPAAYGGAALEANIDVVGAMSFTKECLF